MHFTASQTVRAMVAATLLLTLSGIASGSGLLLDGQGQPVRNSEGHCIQVGALTPQDAAFDCPGVKTPRTDATGGAAASVAPADRQATSTPVASATPAPQPTPAPTLVQQQVHFVSHEQFDVNSSYLSVAQKHELFAFVRGLEQYARLRALSIATRTDSSGAANYNRWLADRRAKAVSAYLRSLGMDPRIIALETDAGPGGLPRGVEITVTVLVKK